MPFLTELDTRAQVKGTRDPLGIQQIWARVGRSVVGNLTTVSTSLRDFTTTLLGYHFAEQIAQESPGTELETFLKWEQMAGYSRFLRDPEEGFRGTERVGRNLDESKKVLLSADGDGQILSNQKVYGLWGLYSAPSMKSGILEETEQRRPTAAGRAMLDEVYLPFLAKGAGRRCEAIVDKLRQPKALLDTEGRDRALVKAIGDLLSPELLPTEGAFYRRHLLEGGGEALDATKGIQPLFVELLEEGLDDEGFEWSPSRVMELAKSTRGRGGQWSRLEHLLLRIRDCESVMAPIAMLFGYLLSLDGKPFDAIVKNVQDNWGDGLRTIDPRRFADLGQDLHQGDVEAAARWNAIAQQAATGEYAGLIRDLIEQNRVVMEERDGRAWMVLRDNKLDVRYQDEDGYLPDREEVRELWRFSYFLDPLRGMTRALRGVGRG